MNRGRVSVVFGSFPSVFVACHIYTGRTSFLAQTSSSQLPPLRLNCFFSYFPVKLYHTLSADHSILDSVMPPLLTTTAKGTVVPLRAPSNRYI